MEVSALGKNVESLLIYHEKDVSVMRFIQFTLLCLFVTACLSGCSSTQSSALTTDKADVGVASRTAQNLERWAPPPVPPAF